MDKESFDKATSAFERANAAFDKVLAKPNAKPKEIFAASEKLNRATDIYVKNVFKAIDSTGTTEPEKKETKSNEGFDFGGGASLKATPPAPISTITYTLRQHLQLKQQRQILYCLMTRQFQ
jgi:hypothetical protein